MTTLSAKRLRHLRSRIADRSLIGFAVLAIPVLATSLWRATHLGWLPLMWLQIGVAGAVIGAAAFRRRLPYIARAGTLVAMPFAVGVFGSVSLGLPAGAPLLFAASSMLAFTLFGRIEGLGILASGLAALAIAYGFSHHGLLLSPVDALAFFASPAVWVTAGLTLVLVVVIVVLSSNYLLHSLVKSIERSDRQKASLAKHLLEMKHFKLALENANQGVFMGDALERDLPIRYVNAAFCRITGYTPDDSIGCNPSFLCRSDLSQPALAEIIGANAGGRPCESTIRAYRKDGGLLWLEVRTAPVRDEAGRLVSYINCLNDVTARVLSEESQRESQKLEAIGQIAGGLAHDFNNFLGVAVGNLDIAAERHPLDRHVATALEAALRATDVTRSLLAVARRQPLPASVNDLNALVRDMLPLIHASAGASITVTAELASGPLLGRFEPGGARQAILNLVINARDAMAGNAGARTLVMKTRAQRIDSHDLPGLSPGEYIVLDIEDNGIGMSPRVRSRAFDPFFTTKDLGKGTGLGLAMVQGYAKQLGGAAFVRNSSRLGTTMSLCLPSGGTPAADQDRSDLTADSRSACPLPTRPWRVLVVDDQKELCELGCTLLRSFGYEAVGTHTAADALDRISAERFDALFTDITMPGPVDGIDLANRALRRWPDLRVLLTTGYSHNVNNRTRLPGPLLDKPYRKTDLKRAMDRLHAEC